MLDQNSKDLSGQTRHSIQGGHFVQQDSLPAFSRFIALLLMDNCFTNLLNVSSAGLSDVDSATATATIHNLALD